MRTVEMIDKEIMDLHEQLDHVEGTKTEVYTRIVGYYRSVANWNRGKREEYNHRQLFSEPNGLLKKGDYTAIRKQSDAVMKTMKTPPVSYTYFYRDSCPNCPPVRDMISRLSIDGTNVNVDKPEGLHEAQEHQVLTSPTVIFFDKNRKELFRAHNTKTLEELFAGTEILV